ncbi:efflux RND transporter periplasmic adaptor subunit [Terriglobus aquaticus]|uniref:Efflux RND transporter periplasmic adaptor subunit n=1 Tax=Terriglobus aquaticus TaxID=940139 RepID=A0ABW9KG19_9BACT|nr:efflux RND transporter periplasmic adaptor subunit [Terriglobus aquaticus]
MSPSSPSEHTDRSASAEHPALPAHASPASTGLPDDAAQHPAPGADVAPPPQRRSSWLRVVILLLIIAAAVAFVVYRIRTNKAADQQQASGARAMANRPVPVAYDLVQQRPVPIYLNALGTVTAYNTVTLKSQVNGQITRVNFREGQRVSQGQLLIEIDPRPYQAALAQAQGNLTRDQANAANAQAEAQRYNQLYAAGVVSKEQAQAQESTSGQAVGSLESDRAAIQAARVNLAFTRITSPISGLVGLRQVDIGNVVAANSSTGLVVITQVEPISVIFTLPEDQLPQVFERMKGGRHLTVEAWDRNNVTKLATGSLMTVDNQIDTTTGTAKLKAVFDNHDFALFPNQFVNIRLILETRQNALTIPAAALQTGSKGSFVYVVDMDHPISPDQTQAMANQSDAAGRRSSSSHSSAGSQTNAPSGGASTSGGSGKGGRNGGNSAMRQTSYPVQERVVQVDLTQGTTVVIRNGLRAGERVVTDGEEKLTSTSKVIPRPAQRVDNQQPGNTSSPGMAGVDPRAAQGSGATRLGSQTGTPNANGGSTDGNGQGGQSNQQGSSSGASHP